MPADRASSIGQSLRRLPDRCLFLIMLFFEPKELLHITAPLSWMWYHLSNTEELWRRLVLLDHVDEDTKVATFSFKGCWKLTYWNPMRESILVPLVAVNEQPNGKMVAENGNNGHNGQQSPQMFVVAVEDWKLQNRKLVAKLTSPQEGPLPKITGTAKAIPSPKLLSDVITHRQLPRSFSINHPHGAGVPPPYSGLSPRESFMMYNVLGEDIMSWPMNLCIDRRDAATLSLEQFQREYEIPNKPLVITNGTNHWPARWKWQPDNFVKHYKDVPFKCNGRQTDGRRFRMKMFDYMSYCTSWNGEKSLYVFDKKVFHRPGGEQLLKDYDTLPYFRDDLFALMSEDDRPDYRWILIGPHGCGTPMHQDPHGTSAWNAVMSGVKRVSFYPPDHIPPGVDEELIDSDYYASEDVMEWYKKTLPKLDAKDWPMECLVGPGDIVYIPSGWWHSVVNIGLTVAVTQNTCSTNCFHRVADEINTFGGKHIRKDFKEALAASPQYQHLAQEIKLKKA